MYKKGKIFILLISMSVVVYTLVGLFYGRVVAENDGYKEIKTFVDVLKRVNDDYVEKPNIQKVMDGAMKGLLEALDPYSGYLPKEKLEEIEKRKQTAKGEIGLELSKRGGLVYVVAPIEDSPAYRAGIRPDDYLDTIDDKPTADLSLIEIASLLRGPENSEVKLTIVRSASSKPIEKKIKREIPKLPGLTAQTLEGNIGHIKTTYLREGIAQEFIDKLNGLMRGGVKKIILDLRNNPGGQFNDALAISNAFLRKGIIVSVRSREGTKVDYEAKSEKAICDLPLVVLVNQSTAGPAEIIAASILDNKRGEVVGEKTFGIGSRQKMVTMKNGSALLLSTEKYLTPSGKPIQDESPRASGIRPSVIYPEESYKSDLLLRDYLDESTDADAKYKKLVERLEREQLQKAIEVLNKEEHGVKKAA